MDVRIIALVAALFVVETSVAQVRNASRANRADIAQAEKFLAELPPACAKSHAYADPDGTVNIRLICSGSGKAMDGLVAIRNGRVIRVD